MKTDLLEKVKRTIIREQLIDDGDLVILAVSGGADSLSLLHILNEIRLKKLISFSLYVAHLNHGLRGKHARDDALFVRQEAKRAGLPCMIGKADTISFAKCRGLSLEDAARRLRYRFLEQLARRTGASRVAVGHTLDDQAETLLLNFLRGTGPDGLAGMRFKRAMGAEGYVLIRPLLETSRREIETYCRQKKLWPRFDKSNLDTRFLRNKIRLELLPYLEKEYNPNIRRSLARLSELINADRDYWQRLAAQRLAAIITEEKPRRLELDVKSLLCEHDSLQGRILRQAISRLMWQEIDYELLPAAPREVSCEHIRAALNLCRQGSPHGALDFPLGLRIARSYNVLVITYGKQPCPAAFAPFFLPVPGERTIPEQGVFLQARLASPAELSWPPEEQREAYLDYDRVVELAAGEKAPDRKRPVLNLLVRTRREGDFFYPLGAPGKTKLKDFFIDRKIPRQERERIPLVLAGEVIIWVAGKQLSHYCRITDRTRKALILSLEQDKGLEE
jgi:tRNA(Ile)-lysidine synthase